MWKGEILFDKYKVERKIGSGGMSDVYLVTNIFLGNKWAAKYIKNSSIAQTETDILKKLNHRSLPQIADIFRDQSGTYIIESYIEGSTLQEKMSGVGCISENKALDWIIQLCDVLAYLHGLKPYPIVYRDLKPSNILVTRDNRIVLVDFGISKIFKKSEHRDRLIAGTNAYAAPEQLIQGGYSDSRSDIYSLGIIMRQLFRTDIKSGYEASNKVMEHIHYIVCRCVEKRPEDRYQEIGDLRRELEKLMYEINLEKAKDKLIFRTLVALSVIFSIITYSFSILGLLVK